MTTDLRWDDLKTRANEVGLLEAAKLCGARLRRQGPEHVGPCPCCGGHDRFSVNPAKGKWNCRGAQGGSQATGLVMHGLGLDYWGALKLLTGEDPPIGDGAGGGKGAAPRTIRATETSRRQVAEEKRDRLEADAAHSSKRRQDLARRIWRQAGALSGTPAQAYLRSRGHGTEKFRENWPESAQANLRFHRRLKHPEGRYFPALVCRVEDRGGDQIGLWRIFLSEGLNGWGKADVEQPKLGLGPCGGGAVRLADARQGEICLAEGVETALAVMTLTGRPCWAALSTSGLVGFEAPEEIDAVRIYADADFSKLNTRTGRWSEPAGLKAARRCAMRLAQQNVAVLDIIAPAMPGSDWEDVMNLVGREGVSGRADLPDKRTGPGQEPVEALETGGAA